MHTNTRLEASCYSTHAARSEGEHGQEDDGQLGLRHLGADCSQDGHDGSRLQGTDERENELPGPISAKTRVKHYTALRSLHLPYILIHFLHSQSIFLSQSIFPSQSSPMQHVTMATSNQPIALFFPPYSNPLKVKPANRKSQPHSKQPSSTVVSLWVKKKKSTVSHHRGTSSIKTTSRWMTAGSMP